MPLRRSSTASCPTMRALIEGSKWLITRTKDVPAIATVAPMRMTTTTKARDSRWARLRSAARPLIIWHRVLVTLISGNDGGTGLSPTCAVQAPGPMPSRIRWVCLKRDDNDRHWQLEGDTFGDH